jgi:hypothetical protein
VISTGSGSGAGKFQRICRSSGTPWTGTCRDEDDAVGPPSTVAEMPIPGTSPPDTTLTETSPGDTAAQTIDVSRAWSPENAVAEVNGTGAVAADPVTVDGAPADVTVFTTDADGSFTVRVRIEDEGAHTVCVRDACSRVFTRAPDAESIEEVEAKIAEAIPLAAELFDGVARFPGWTIDVAGPLSGTGGQTDTERKAIVIRANRGRSVEEYVTTILHEWGHVVDVELLTDADRVAYRELRGFPADQPWQDEVTHSIEQWGSQPVEDFAEVMVAEWTSSTAQPHEVRTAAGAADAATLDAVRALVAS